MSKDWFPPPDELMRGLPAAVGALVSIGSMSAVAFALNLMARERIGTGLLLLAFAAGGFWVLSKWRRVRSERAANNEIGSR